MYTLLYLDYDVKTNISFLVDIFGISLQTLKRVCKEIKNKESLLIPHYLHSGILKSLKGQNQKVNEEYEIMVSIN